MSIRPVWLLGIDGVICPDETYTNSLANWGETTSHRLHSPAGMRTVTIPDEIVAFLNRVNARRSVEVRWCTNWLRTSELSDAFGIPDFPIVAKSSDPLDTSYSSRLALDVVFAEGRDLVWTSEEPISQMVRDTLTTMPEMRHAIVWGPTETTALLSPADFDRIERFLADRDAL